MKCGACGAWQDEWGAWHGSELEAVRVYAEAMHKENNEVRRERNYLKQYVERLAAGVPIPDTPSSILSALSEEGK